MRNTRSWTLVFVSICSLLVLAGALATSSSSRQPVADESAPVQFPARGGPIGLTTPEGITAVVVPSLVRQPRANYVTMTEIEGISGELPTPGWREDLFDKTREDRQRTSPIEDETAGTSDPSEEDLGRSRGDGRFESLPSPPFQPNALTPALSSSFNATDFDTNATNTGGFLFIPPDPIGAAGPSHVVNVTNVTVQFYTKAGVKTFDSSLASFFASLSPATFTFDPKVIYDQIAGRFLIVTLEREDIATTGIDDSRIFLAVSDDSNPNGTWYFTSIAGDEVFTNLSNGMMLNHWADYPGFAIDEEAVYITTNMFPFASTGFGGFGGVRLWIVDKGVVGGFYAGAAAGVSKFDPYLTAGSFARTTQPAHVFGTAPVGVGTWLMSFAGLNNGVIEFVQSLRVDTPLGVPTFTLEFIGVGALETLPLVTFPDAPQMGSSVDIETNDRRALHAVWRDNNRLYLTTEILPVAGPDAGQVTAHWFRLDTAVLGGMTLDDQGSIGGEDIAAGAFTFYPSIAVNSNHTMAVGFSASAPTIYAGAYYATRELTDAAGTIGGSVTLRAGLDFYVRTFDTPMPLPCLVPPAQNRWGDYSGMAVDPLNQCFWVYNEYAILRGTATAGGCVVPGMEDGRWGTAFGNFCMPFCGDTLVNAPGETCDPPGAAAGGNGNVCRGDCTVCGDMVVDGGAGEACDDGNGINGDGCENDCTVTAFCGDGMVNAPGETCDPPGSAAGGNGNLCRANCTVCGDMVVDGGAGEACDDGNGTNGDGCENNCSISPFCGDGMLNVPGETCDPPGSPAGGNGNLCRANCTVCGDMVVDGGAGEACDDGNGVNGDGCENNCTITPFCGDGLVNAPGETCDPPGAPAGGNGNLCRANCTVCGDMVVDGGAGEACDDGNGTNGDGCENNCTITPFCGDGMINVPGETCDPPGSAAGGNGNVCRGDCTVCGDLVVDAGAGEECDDGNGIDGDGCSNVCLFERSTVFVSSTKSDGNLAGIAGADVQCTVLANMAGLPGAYKAWLADSTGGPSITFFQSPSPYVLVNGTKIADDFADLTDGTLDAPINVTQVGGVLSAPVGSQVWTGANADGTPRDGGALCSDWTMNSAFDRGAVGRPDKTDSKWSFSGATPCDRKQRLYCVEQLTPILPPPLPVPKTIFVTSTQSNGNLGGIAGADGTCNALATAAGLGGSYKAWLSDGASDPDSTFSKVALGYFRPDLTLVAVSYADLTDGVLAATISVTETLGVLPGPSGSKVWTGTSAFGTKLDGARCGDWTSASSALRGAQGRTSSTTSTWSFSGASPCNQQRRLYCVEQ